MALLSLRLNRRLCVYLSDKIVEDLNAMRKIKIFDNRGMFLISVHIRTSDTLRTIFAELSIKVL